MDHSEPLITIVVLLGATLLGGMIAHRLRQPVMLGYLLVGVIVGPHGLGLVRDLEMVETAATIGVALLMFMLGLEISPSQLRQVGKVGPWGGIVQIAGTFGLGTLVARYGLGWALQSSVVFGLVISLSSTAVCLKILMERGELTSVHGRIMLAVLIVQDLAVVPMMVVTPLMGGDLAQLPLDLALAAGKALAFVGAAVVSGIWLLPFILGRVGGVRSRELFLLTMLTVSLGAALATRSLGLSAVFGSFLIGLLIRGPRFGYQALADVTPLRDTFATVFFVSLGMLLDFDLILAQWGLVAVTVGIILGVKIAVLYGVVRLFRYSNRIALLTGAGLFQVGEFGFILAQAGLAAGLIDADKYSLILASAIVSMLLTPVALGLASRLYPRLVHAPPRAVAGARPQEEERPARVVVAGHGRIGQNVAQGLHDAGVPYVVVDLDPQRIADARKAGRPRIYGDASNRNVLTQAGITEARTLVVAFPDPLAALATVRTALELNPRLHIVARVHQSQEANQMKRMGVTELVSPEYEASLELLRRALAASGWKKSDIRRTLPLVEGDKEIVRFSPEDE